MMWKYLEDAGGNAEPVHLDEGVEQEAGENAEGAWLLPRFHVERQGIKLQAAAQHLRKCLADGAQHQPLPHVATCIVHIFFTRE